MSERFLLPPDCNRRRRAHRRNHDGARRRADAGFHAGRHASGDQGRASRRRARVRRGDSARQHLSSDAAAVGGARRGARRAACIHALAVSDPHRFRRLSGDVARAAAEDHRGGRHVPLAPRRRDGRADAGARDGGADPARLRYRHAARRMRPASGRASRDRARDEAVAALGRTQQTRFRAARRPAAPLFGIVQGGDDLALARSERARRSSISAFPATRSADSPSASRRA